MNRQEYTQRNRAKTGFFHRNLPPEGPGWREALDARRGDSYDYEPEILFTEDGEEEVYYASPVYARLPKDLMRVELFPDCEAEFVGDRSTWTKFAVPDWDVIAKRAGLDKGEKHAMKARVAGKTRNDLMQTAKNETERLAYQASWKRLERKWANVLEVLKPPR